MKKIKKQIWGQKLLQRPNLRPNQFLRPVQNLGPSQFWDQASFEARPNNAKGARPGFRVCRSFTGLANVPSNQIPYYGELRFCNIGRFVSHHHDVGYGISRGLSNGFNSANWVSGHHSATRLQALRRLCLYATCTTCIDNTKRTKKNFKMILLTNF